MKKNGCQLTECKRSILFPGVINMHANPSRASTKSKQWRRHTLYLSLLTEMYLLEIMVKSEILLCTIFFVYL